MKKISILLILVLILPASATMEEYTIAYNTFLSLNTQENINILNNLMDGYKIFLVYDSPITNQNKILIIVFNNDKTKIDGFFCLQHNRGITDCDGSITDVNSIYEGTESQMRKLTTYINDNIFWKVVKTPSILSLINSMKTVGEIP